MVEWRIYFILLFGFNSVNIYLGLIYFYYGKVKFLNRCCLWGLMKGMVIYFVI